MKSIRILVPVALVALTAMAFVGTSSVMAENTALCKADESPCKASNAITHVHEATLAESPALLLNNLGNVKCDVLFLSTSVGGSAAPQIILGNFTYSNCFRKKLKGEESCTVAEINGPGEIKVLKEGHETAKVTGEGEVKVACGEIIQCVYSGENLIATAKGPLLSKETNGEVSLSEQETHKVSGTLCPAESELDFTTTPLSATYISSGVAEESALCKTDENPCKAGKNNSVTHVHEVTTTNALLLNSLGNVKCAVLFLSTSVGSSGAPLIIKGNYTYSSCFRKKLFGGEEACTVTELSSPVVIKVLRTTHETGEVTGEGEVEVKCGSTIECVYNGEGLIATAKGPLLSTAENGEVRISEQTTHAVKGAFCPEVAKLDITITPLEPTYILSGEAEKTALCKIDKSPCEEGTSNLITHVHETTSAESPVLFLSNSGNVKCNALFLSTSVEGLATPQIILGKFTYSSCLRKKLKGEEESCTVTEKNGPAEIKVLKEGHETAKVTAKGEVEVLCGSILQCVYNAENLIATAKGPLLSKETNGEVSLSEQETHKVSGTLCPAESELDLTTTPLEATYIST